MQFLLQSYREVAKMHLFALSYLSLYPYVTAQESLNVFL
jgi:hypothetical protein